MKAFTPKARNKTAAKIRLVLVLWFLCAEVFAQERGGERRLNTVDDVRGEKAAVSDRGDFPPEALRRPERGEAPRYPVDLVIGELGRGEAPEAAFLFAERALEALCAAGAGETNPPGGVREELWEELARALSGLGTLSFRLGGGRTEGDGSVSFLTRFIGRTDSVAGELFVREDEGGAWVLDDLVLEEKRPLGELRDSYRYDFSPYERFY